MGELLFGLAPVAGTVGAGGAITGAAAATPGLLGTGGAFAAGQAITTVGATAGVGFAIQASQKQASIGRAQQRLAEKEAESIKAKRKFDLKRQAKRAAQIKSSLKARIAKAGGLGSPVAEDLALEQEAELELEGLLLAERSFEDEEFVRLGGRIARQKSSARAAEYLFDAGEPLLKGFAEPLLGTAIEKRRRQREEEKNQ